MSHYSFLKAEWRKLVMINYQVDPSVLLPFVPVGTEIDIYNDTCYVSLVGFMFLNTRVLGLKIPFHQDFEEVNLRFYVRYQNGAEMRRGVVFIKEIVPKHAITFVANSIYGEKYETMPMKHQWFSNEKTIEVDYGWKKDSWNTIKVVCRNLPSMVGDGSEEDFITNHFWGYTKISETVTSEYEVVHPVWTIYPVIQFDINVDFRNTYGKSFSFLTGRKPVSVFLAEGSEIVVKKGRRFN